MTNPETGEIIVGENTYVTEDLAEAVVKAGVKQVWIRNIFTCDSTKGICAKCYGKNMATGNPVEAGEAIGVMAAQAIGEPGTQLTMRNFHAGGAATQSGDITQGLPRVEELFEARTPKRVAVIAKIDGEITDIKGADNHAGNIITVSNAKESIEHKCDLTQPLLGWVKVGVKVTAGQAMTEGSIAPKELLQVAGVRAVEEYILKEVKKVYASQSIDISDKHLEVMIRQMLRKVMITDGGDSGYVAGQSLSIARMNEINNDLLDEGKTPAQYAPILLGISKAAVETDSFLSAASFQETTRVLTDAAVHGKVDHLEGLKENVIIGKLIPAGTGRPSYNRETTKRILAKAEYLKEHRRERQAAAAEAARPQLPESMTRGGESDDDDFNTEASPAPETPAENTSTEE